MPEPSVDTVVDTVGPSDAGRNSSMTLDPYCIVSVHILRISNNNRIRQCSKNKKGGVNKKGEIWTRAFSKILAPRRLAPPEHLPLTHPAIPAHPIPAATTSPISAQPNVDPLWRKLSHMLLLFSLYIEFTRGLINNTGTSRVPHQKPTNTEPT